MVPRTFDLNVMPEEENENMEIEPKIEDKATPFTKAIGFKFSPTDPEILIGYLKPFLAKEMLPDNKIYEQDIYLFHPNNLEERFEKANEKELYFITVRNGAARVSRSANNGYWHATTGTKSVLIGDLVIGEKQSFTFYNGKPIQGKPDKNAKTKWLMVEYRSVDTDPNTGFAVRNKHAVLSKIYRSDCVEDPGREYADFIRNQQNLALRDEQIWNTRS